MFKLSSGPFGAFGSSTTLHLKNAGHRAKQTKLSASAVSIYCIQSNLTVKSFRAFLIFEDLVSQKRLIVE